MFTSPGSDADELPFRRGDAIDRFTVLELIGMGGMGVVVSAYDCTLDRKVAIKVLRPDRASVQPDAGRARLLREAQAMARLSHPNVITVYEVGTVGDGVFVAMELVEGETLARWLRREPRPWRDVVQVFSRAGNGLLAAHRVGIVHRDFKPENVLVDAGGEVRVTDFGLAGITDDARVDAANVVLGASLTRTGMVMGTPAYMSPEQHRRQPADARSDQFSFCVALYEALYGVRPFEGNSAAEVLDSITTGRLVAGVKEAPRWLRPLVVRGLAARPEDRWPNMDALLRTLESVPRRRRQRLVGAGVAVLAIGVAALAVWRPAAHRVDACATAAADVESVWGDRARDALRAAFTASGRPLADDGAQRIGRRFDTWARRWRETRVETCRRVGTGELATAAAQPRVDCMARLLEQLRARVTLLSDAPSGDVIDRALDLAVLPEVDACATLGEGVALPVDPVQRAAVQAAFREVDQLDLERVRLRGRGLSGPAAALVARAEGLRWPPLIHSSRAVAARIAYDTGDCEQALALSAKVAESAPSEGQIELAAEMWDVRLACARRRDDTAGLDHALLAARALVRQLPGSAASVELQVSIGAAEESRGRLEAAEEACRTAVTSAERLPTDSPTRAAPHMCLSAIYSQRGQNAEALAAAEATLAARERALGPSHPVVAVDLQNLGVGYQRLGRTREAVVAKRRSLAIEEAFWGGDHPRVATALQSLGWTLTRVGEIAEAHRHATRALAIVERTPPSAAGDLIMFYLLAAETRAADETNQARAWLERAREICATAGAQYAWYCAAVHERHAVALMLDGQCRRGLPLIAEAMKHARSIEGIEPSALATLFAVRGQCLSQLGDHRAAVAELQQALALVASDAPAADKAAVNEALGRALIAAGRSRPRAAELLRGARTLYVEAGPGHDEDIRKVDQLLRDLDVRP